MVVPGRRVACLRMGPPYGLGAAGAGYICMVRVMIVDDGTPGTFVMGVNVYFTVTWTYDLPKGSVPVLDVTVGFGLRSGASAVAASVRLVYGDIVCWTESLCQMMPLRAQF